MTFLDDVAVFVAFLVVQWLDFNLLTPDVPSVHLPGTKNGKRLLTVSHQNHSCVGNSLPLGTTVLKLARK